MQYNEIWILEEYLWQQYREWTESDTGLEDQLEIITRVQVKKNEILGQWVS